MIYIIHISLSSYNRYKLNSLLTYYQQGFIAHREIYGAGGVFSLPIFSQMNDHVDTQPIVWFFSLKVPCCFQDFFGLQGGITETSTNHIFGDIVKLELEWRHNPRHVIQTIGWAFRASILLNQSIKEMCYWQLILLSKCHAQRYVQFLNWYETHSLGLIASRF